MTHLIVGGAPAGRSIPPVEEGCRTIKIRINTMTTQGNRSTAPRGIDIFEFPFKRMRRRKNDNLDEMRVLSRGGSSRGGGLGMDGIRLTSFCTKPILSLLLLDQSSEGRPNAVLHVLCTSLYNPNLYGRTASGMPNRSRNFWFRMGVESLWKV